MQRLDREEAARFLDSPLLAGVADRSRRAIFAKLSGGHLAAGTPLLSQGKPNDRLWFLVEGAVVVERTQPDGRVDLMATLTGPGILGTTTFFRSTSPSATVRASSDMAFGTLDREGHEALRRDDPEAAEALALAVVRVLAERFDLLDARLTDLMAEHGDDHPRASEWADFRSRLFEDS